jgi:hypothetical protein
MGPLGGRLAGAGDAGLGVDDDPVLEQAGGHQRLEREDRRGRITARAGDQRRVFQFGPIPFGQSVGGLRIDRGGMRVPTIASRAVLETERAGQIEHPAAPGRQRRCDIGGDAVRECQKHCIGLRREAIDIERFDGRIPDFGE